MQNLFKLAIRKRDISSFRGNFVKNLKHTIALGSLIVFSSCATDAPPPAPPPPPPPPPIVKKEPPPIIPVGIAASEFSTSLYNMAGFFPQFADEVARAANPNNLTTVAAISESLDRSTLYARSETIDGAKAYATIAAAQSSAFRDGISKIGTPMGRAIFIQYIQSNPNWIKSIDGYEDALSLASHAIGHHMSIIESSSDYLKARSYDLQKTPIAKVVVPKDARLKALDANFLVPLNTSNFSDVNIKTNSNAPQTVDNRIVSAAALLIIRADKEALDMLRLGTGNSCTKNSLIDMKMCVSATKYSYEHAYCMSEYYKLKFAQCIHENVNDPVEVRRIKQEAADKINQEHAAAAQKRAAAEAAKMAKTKKTPAKKAPAKKK